MSSALGFSCLQMRVIFFLPRAVKITKVIWADILRAIFKEVLSFGAVRCVPNMHGHRHRCCMGLMLCFAKLVHGSLQQATPFWFFLRAWIAAVNLPGLDHGSFPPPMVSH